MSASFVKSLVTGWLNLATATKSPKSLYKPTVVIKVLGLSTIEVKFKVPVVSMKEGLVV